MGGSSPYGLSWGMSLFCLYIPHTPQKKVVDICAKCAIICLWAMQANTSWPDAHFYDFLCLKGESWGKSRRWKFCFFILAERLLMNNSIEVPFCEYVMMAEICAELFKQGIVFRVDSLAGSHWTISFVGY